MRTFALLPALQSAVFAPPPPRSRECSIDQSVTAETIADWARAAATELLDQLPETVADSVAVVAEALTADALINGRPPHTIRVTATDKSVDVALTGARGIAERTLSNDVPGIVEARKRTTHWRTHLGPNDRGSVVVASVPLRTRRRFTWLHRRRSR